MGKDQEARLVEAWTMSEWQPIETCPKGQHKVVDLWCVGQHDDIAFYCSDYCATGSYVNGYHEYQGRITNVYWRRDAWRPKSKLLLHSITVTPTHWMPVPPPPSGTGTQA
jgi:hypothetical protein